MEHPAAAAARALVRAAWAGAALAAALAPLSAAHALGVADLQPAVRDELQRAGLVNDAAPIPAFHWTLENRRPLRHPRTIDERYAASADGLSLVQRATTYADGKVDRDERISARGLLRVDGGDRSIDVNLEGLALPPRQGERFTLQAVRDGNPVRETCHVGDTVSAADLFPGLPGDAVNIACTGQGEYAGIPVRMSSRVVYFAALGVFLNSVDVLDTPLGRFENGNRITDFKLDNH